MTTSDNISVLADIRSASTAPRPEYHAADECRRMNAPRGKIVLPFPVRAFPNSADKP